MALSRAGTYWNSEARTGSGMALSSADKRGHSIPKLGSGKARTRWRRDGRAWFSIVVAKQCTELLRSRKENEMGTYVNCELTDGVYQVQGDKIWKYRPKGGKETRHEVRRWIPIKWHEITDEERRANDYPEEWAIYFDCEMPSDGEEILVTSVVGIVEKDVCYEDDGLFLDSGADWIEGITAWMPLPKPYEVQP